MRCSVVVLFVVGLGGSVGCHHDSLEQGSDQDLSTADRSALSGEDLSFNLNSLCASPACAAAPCTSGCLYTRNRGHCAPGFEVIDQAAAKTCARFCGLPTTEYGQPVAAGQPPPGGSCGHYDYSLPGQCQASPCNFYDACYVADAAYAEDQAIICPPSSTCYDNSQPSPADLAVACGDGGI
jgi:hypothetical protein